MSKLKLILLSILISTNVFAQQDSLTISELQNTVTSLTSKVETLNEVNNKILKTVHLTIGLIVAVFLGVGVFNSISNRRLNEQKFNNYISGLDEKFTQLKKSTTDSILNVQKEWKTEFTEYEKKATELISNKTNEVQETISKSLNSTMNKKLYQLDINIVKSKLKTLNLEHERVKIEEKLYALEQKVDKSNPWKPAPYFNPVDEFNRIIEMCYLSHKVAIADRYAIPVNVTNCLRLLHNFLQNNPIDTSMNDSLTKLLIALKNSQYDFRNSINAINSSIRISNDMPIV